MSELLHRERAALLVIDVQERINAVMADQGHIPRLEMLVDAFQTLDVPVISSEQYPQGLGETLAGRLAHRATQLGVGEAVVMRSRLRRSHAPLRFPRRRSAG